MNIEKEMSKFDIFESLLRKHGYENSFRAAEEYASQQTAVLQRNWEHEIKNSMELKASVDNISENFANLQIEYGKKCSELNELKDENERIQNDSFGFIIRGYYNRILMNNPTIEEIIGWLESDLQEVRKEDVLHMAKEILKQTLNPDNNDK